MVVEVATVHEVEDEAEFVLGVEGVGHADNEGAVVASADQTQHDPLVEGQRFALLHLNALLIKTLKQSESVRVTHWVLSLTFMAYILPVSAFLHP